MFLSAIWRRLLFSNVCCTGATRPARGRGLRICCDQSAFFAWHAMPLFAVCLHVPLRSSTSKAGCPFKRTSFRSSSRVKGSLQCNVWTTSIHRVIRTDPVHYVSLGVWIHSYWFFCWKWSACVPKRGCHFGPPFLVLCIVFLSLRTQKGVHFGPPFWRPWGPILESQGGVQAPRCWKQYVGTSQTARILTKSCMDSRGLHKAASIHNAQALILSDVPKVKTSETHVTWQQCP